MVDGRFGRRWCWWWRWYRCFVVFAVARDGVWAQMLAPRATVGLLAVRCKDGDALAHQIANRWLLATDCWWRHGRALLAKTPALIIFAFCTPSATKYNNKKYAAKLHTYTHTHRQIFMHIYLCTYRHCFHRRQRRHSTLWRKMLCQIKFICIKSAYKAILVAYTHLHIN